uniref:Uncharacterized protein n=2 Tax=Nicotiana TaxID=4085 RepID=A0A1S3YHT9_TOBAC|nr:PREDICTED: uncharacterized protein LOC104211979 [Nicotiana sylvestris]XP_009759442.1 PREDICTED: uncharacterized protein LOC104211979 [Nicotiana sylvestris]XP_009759443.1 PREDICTED: uncharacterized protein LOC104211979 [Nicotiana sylvestris]XP_016451685.1 PREDICTED: uncharacterized protein LOC107776318 [Nicotiana tabacum]
MLRRVGKQFFLIQRQKNSTKGDDWSDCAKKDMQSELQNRQSSRKTANDAFKVVFGNEQPGQVRCYGRSVTTRSPKKDEKITKLKQQHANKITSLKEEMMREEMRYFFSQLVKNNPALDFHDIQGCVGSNIPSLVDASSA